MKSKTLGRIIITHEQGEIRLAPIINQTGKYTGTQIISISEPILPLNKINTFISNATKHAKQLFKRSGNKPLQKRP